MTIELSVFAVVVTLFVVNTVLEHLFNWWIRLIEEEDYIIRSKDSYNFSNFK